MEKNSKIYVAGHTGLVGSAIIRNLIKKNFGNIITKEMDELNLINCNTVADFFKREKPEYVFIAAAKVGGILANNTKKAEFIYENLQIQNNIIHNSYLNNVKKLLFLGSSCIYPKLCPQPIKEEYLLSGYLEETNNAYAIAKIAGITMCQSYNMQYNTNYISVMPTNLFGYNDNFDLASSHVLPALIRKFHEAKVNGNDKSNVVIWGSGKPKREFLFVEDLAEAILFLMENINAKDLYENGISQLNIGTGEDLSISELASLISDAVSFKGEIVYDSSKPDGTPRKLMDVSRINNLGWKYKTSLREGVAKTYEWFLDNV